MTAYEVIDVIAMWNPLVSATRAVRVLGGVIAALVLGGAAFRITAGYWHCSVVKMIAVRDVHVAIVQVTSLLAIANAGVPAIAAMLMIVLLMLMVALHDLLQ